MSRAYELHQNGDCNDFCRICEREDANEQRAEEDEEDES